MKRDYINLLRCIKCRGPLNLSEDHHYKIRHNKIELGVLSCSQCGSLYPIMNGIGVFFPNKLLRYYLNEKEKETCCQLGLKYEFLKNELNKIERKQLDVAKNWSYEWNEVYNYSKEDLDKDDFFGENSFFKFIPITPADFSDKVVVIWCGGKGRESYHISKYKPRLIVVNEIGDEIYGINAILPENAEPLLIRCDMTNNPLMDGFADYSICDHALQHVSDHRLGFKKILDALKPGGIIAINVYSYENNFLMTHIIEPLKFIFHRFPLKIQQNIARLPAVIIFVLIRFIYIPAKKIFPKQVCEKLPLFEHMMFWSKSSFKFFCMTCFDLIHAPISHHFRKFEIQEMAKSNKVIISELTNTHSTTWTLIGKK
ncbi:MAG: methyltransferase domain-containing protein [Candidatus Melainabacteria bacterium]|nr:methyltransferase domain-containing protein [Candidatus Melainabacteria bacterium]